MAEYKHYISYKHSLGVKRRVLSPSCPLLIEKKPNFDSVQVAFFVTIATRISGWLKKWYYLFKVLVYKFMLDTF